MDLLSKIPIIFVIPGASLYLSEDTSYIRFIGARIKREAEINNFRWGESLLRKMKNLPYNFRSNAVIRTRN